MKKPCFHIEPALRFQGMPPHRQYALPVVGVQKLLPLVRLDWAIRQTGELPPPPIVIVVPPVAVPAEHDLRQSFGICPKALLAFDECLRNLDFPSDVDDHAGE